MFYVFLNHLQIQLITFSVLKPLRLAIAEAYNKFNLKGFKLLIPIQPHFSSHSIDINL